MLEIILLISALILSIINLIIIVIFNYLILKEKRRINNGIKI